MDNFAKMAVFGLKLSNSGVLCFGETRNASDWPFGLIDANLMMLKLLQFCQRPLRRQLRIGAAQSLSHDAVENQGNEADGSVRLDPPR